MAKYIFICFAASLVAVRSLTPTSPADCCYWVSQCCRRLSSPAVALLATHLYYAFRRIIQDFCFIIEWICHGKHWICFGNVINILLDLNDMALCFDVKVFIKMAIGQNLAKVE